MNGLELNKIAAAILLAGLIAMISGTVANVLYFGGMEHGEGEVKRGFQVEGVESADAGSGAATADVPVDIAAYLGAGDPAAGEKTKAKCTSCHTFDKGGANGVGPNLYGIVGSKHAHKDDFAYSDAMKAKHGETWDYQTLSEFIAHPAKTIPGTKMGFAGIKKPEERANLLAYLRTLSDAPVAFPPAPKPGASPAAAPEKQAPADKPGTGTEASTPATPGAAAVKSDVKPGEGKQTPAAPVGASGKAENANPNAGKPDGSASSGTTVGKSDVPVETGKTSGTAEPGDRAPGNQGK